MLYCTVACKVLQRKWLIGKVLIKNDLLAENASLLPQCFAMELTNW
jgi:hypothetical protein